jgi:8-hydroxy-5-deazaflavin:NADPH oxidoreductase
MDIGVLGTGPVGKTIAARLDELGNKVVMGTHDPNATLAKTEPDYLGNPPISTWLEKNSGIKLASFSESAAFGEIVINATTGTGSLSNLEAAGKENLKGKLLIDISNPMDKSKSGLPSFFVTNTDSLGEQIQRAFPETKVVKTLNTVNVRLMAHPLQLNEGHHSIFMCGNDLEAKAQVREILISFGWQDIIDLGDITTARGTEMYMALQMRLRALLKTGIFNIQVVR